MSAGLVPMFANDDDHWEGRNEPFEIAGIGCRYCLAGPLWWYETEQGWRLVDERGAIHSCEQYDAIRKTQGEG